MTNTRVLVLITFLGSLMISAALAWAAPADPGSGPVPSWVETQPGEAPVLIAPVPDKTEDPVEAMTEFYRAIKGGDYWYAVGLCLALLTFGFRKLLAWRKIEWFATDRGGVASAGITALLSTGALLLIAQRAPSWGLLWAMLTATLVAMGGYAGVKKLLWPSS